MTMPRRSKGLIQSREKTLARERQKLTTGRNGLLRRGRMPWLLAGLGGGVVLLTLALIGWSAAESPAWLQRQAEAAARAGDWATALQHWRAVNATKAARSTSYLGEARACLALGRAAQAEHSLHQAINADPSNPEAWRLLLQILRIEDRVTEAQQLGWKAYEQVSPVARRELLRELTLGLVAELPDELVRTTLRRWIDADNSDTDAEVALWQRINAQPRAADPDRPAVLTALETLLANYPDHIGAREALVTALANAGEPDRGRAILNEWPESSRDARYWRLRGRWELEYDHRPDQATANFQTALVELPHDWRSWYRLARALRILNRDSESRQAAETESRIREVLDPLVLEPRLDAAFDHLDDLAALRDLAMLCQQVGLSRLANAWLTETQHKAQPPAYSLFAPAWRMVPLAINEPARSSYCDHDVAGKEHVWREEPDC
jgi:thioredoxin-like negative regulator of GroEL